jgi:hypothetical protein
LRRAGIEFQASDLLFQPYFVWHHRFSHQKGAGVIPSTSYRA